MKRWTQYLLPLGLIAVLLGLGGIAIVIAGIFKAVIAIFLTAFVVSIAALTLALRAQERQGPPDGRSTTVSGALGAWTRSLSD